MKLLTRKSKPKLQLLESLLNEPTKKKLNLFLFNMTKVNKVRDIKEIGK